MNNPFKDYTENSMSEVQIRSKHKEELAQKMFENRFEKKPFWTWTKAIFTAPVLATIAIYFFFNFNEKVFQEVLLPQEALAQVLENTFDLDSFATTFGLPDDGKLHHRIIHSKSVMDMYGISESKSGRTDLWSDGDQVRKDNLYNVGDSGLKMLNSTMIDQHDHLCHTGKMSVPECVSLKDVQEERVEQIISNHGLLYPVVQEGWISDLKGQLTTNHDMLGVLLSWSTIEPIEKKINIWTGNSLTTINSGVILSSEQKSVYHSHDDLNYINQLKDDKYWHSAFIDIDHLKPNLNSDNIYFQIQMIDAEIESAYQKALAEREGNAKSEDFQFITKASIVYQFDPSDGQLIKLPAQKVISEIKSHTVLQETLDDALISILGPALYIMKNPNEFKNPNSVEDTEYKGENIIKLNYSLSKDYFLQFGHYTAEEYSKYSIDLFMDSSQTKFLGYSFKKDGKELHSIWIEDEILPNSQKSDLFNKAKWLELANENYNSLKHLDT